MPILDFKEIPIPTSGENRDQFELFAREFLELKGFKEIVGPDRGPDGGRDIIVEETRTGVGGEIRVKWLVSCKHKAHSGASVTPDDERDILDRVSTHNCDGFIGFYSTLPSSGLAAKLNASDLRYETLVYDRERIERECLESSQGLALVRRFFPNSYDHWEVPYPNRADIYLEKTDLLCWNCEKSLLLPKPSGIVVEWSLRHREGQPRKEHCQHIYWCCKGQCDDVLKIQYRRKDLADGWTSISGLLIPIVYIRRIMAMFNMLHDGTTYSNDALYSSKKLLLNLFPFISRSITEEERKRIEMLITIPQYFGGLGENPK